MEKVTKQVEKLIKKLKSSKENTRIEATKTLGEIAKKNPDIIKEAIPSLIIELEDLNNEVRSYAVIAIGNVGEYRPEYVNDAIRFLTQCVNDNDSTVRRNALETLGKIGKNIPEEIKYAIPSIINCLRHDVWRVRREATSALSNIGEMNSKLVKGAIPQLIENLSDSNKRVRIDTAKALAIIERGNLKDDDWKTRREAATAIGNIGKHKPRYVKEAIPVLIETLNDENSEVRSESAKALVKINEEKKYLIDALPILLSALNSKNSELREKSILTITQISNNEQFEENLLFILFTALASKHPGIKSNAAMVISQIGLKKPNLVKDAIPLLLKNIEEEDNEVYRAATNALDTIGAKLLEQLIKPELGIVITTSKEIHIGEWKDIFIALVNKGSAHAENIEIEFTGALEMRNDMDIPILKIGKNNAIKNEIKPKALGRVPIGINTTFQDFKGSRYIANDIGWIEIKKKGEKFEDDEQIIYRGNIGRNKFSVENLLKPNC